MSKNLNMINAKKNKNDEFYTQLSDIERELKHYVQYFKDKIILCNCDDPRVSNFVHYFLHNFERLKLKKLIVTCYKNRQMDLFSLNDSEKPIYLEYDGGMKIPDVNKIGIKYLKGDGDFRSRECIKILKQADIVVTNPPFSLFREYVTQLVKYDKKFIIIGNIGATVYKEIFKLLKENKLWYGYNIGKMKFKLPNYHKLKKNGCWEDENGQKWQSLGITCWFTNLDIDKRYEKLILCKKYNSKEYPKYDNYDAINVNKTKDIPVDYDGMMGVPITFMHKYNPDQFEIIGLASDKREVYDYFIQGKPTYLDKQHKKFVGMVLKEQDKLRATYARIIIKRKNNV